jgi:methyl-accepting chemotaxis protein
MTENLSTISGSLAASSEELAASAAESTKTINQVVNSVNEIAVGNNVQAETIAKVSENILSMASRIYDVDKATEINSENSKSSLEAIEEGQKAIDLTIQKIRENMQVSDVVEATVTDLSSQMDKVVNIIDVIGAISEQTNLLSLNASIEAARAGDAGRGFAVVAAEIGKLSKNTANSVSEITGIITETVEKNKETAASIAKARELALEQEKAIQITKDAFKKIEVSVDDIAVLSEEITNQIKQINASAVEITNQTQDMSAVSQESAASSEEISATNEEQLASIEMMAASANELSIMAAELNNEISKFKI